MIAVAAGFLRQNTARIVAAAIILGLYGFASLPDLSGSEQRQSPWLQILFWQTGQMLRRLQLSECACLYCRKRPASVNVDNFGGVAYAVAGDTVSVVPNCQNPALVISSRTCGCS